MTRFIRQREGFTLVELMVVMAVIVLLTAMVMLVAPNVLAKDRARDAATQIQGALQNARMRATRDLVPRGVRLIIDPTSVGSSSGSVFTTSSSYQYIEVPPWLVLTNQSGTNINPFLQLLYTLSTGANPQVINRTCTIGNLTTTQLSQLQTIVNSNTTSLPPTLGLPTLNFWTSIIQGSLTVTSGKFPCSCTINLWIWPDSALGAQTNWVATLSSTGDIIANNNSTPLSPNGPAYFGIYQSPRPLLGEPVMNLPVNTTVDLSDGVSSPSFAMGLQGYSSNGIQGYDILFAPSGQMMLPPGYSQVFLWVRDPTKGIVTPGLPANPDRNGGAFCSMSTTASSLGPYGSAQYSQALNQGGEQLLVTIKANSGGTGVSPVFWPTAPGQTPYNFALSAANAP